MAGGSTPGDAQGGAQGRSPGRRTRPNPAQGKDFGHHPRSKKAGERWKYLPALLTAVAAVITSVAAILGLLLTNNGHQSNDPPETSTPLPSPTASSPSESASPSLPVSLLTLAAVVPPTANSVTFVAGTPPGSIAGLVQTQTLYYTVIGDRNLISDFCKAATVVQRYQIAGQGFTQFKAMVGVTDNSVGGVQVHFQVELNGSSAATQWSRVEGQLPSSVDISIGSAVETLTLVTTEEDCASQSLTGVWINPVLLK